MKVCIISGSSRENNNTIRLARAFENEIRSRSGEVTIIDFKSYDLPIHANDRFDPDNLTSFQQQLIDGIANAGVVIILTPEYNWFPSAEIVNMFHLLGTRKMSYLFDNKVFALAGVSIGKGGRMPAVQMSYVLDKIISYFNKKAITSPLKFESHFTVDMIDENGAIRADGTFKKRVEDFIDYTLDIAKLWFR